MTALAAPLSAAELDELEAFLTSEATPEECMDLETLDGFLTGIVSGPEAIQPGEWLPWVWNADGVAGQGPEFADEPQARRILELMMRHMNGIAATLLNSPADFAPVLYEPEDETERLPLARRWCLGYLTALGLREPEWAPLTEHAERAEVMMPLYALAAEEDDPDLGAAAREPAERSRLADMLPVCAAGIHGFWLARRSGWTLPRRNPDKVGRNDPCPCGSGRKYKQCCGANG
ncbi:MAG TPA: UPF0149 family protein [Burkholderiales bacterium]|nr:UPF0149 family protein [Burkholderiales bacterium]